MAIHLQPAQQPLICDAAADFIVDDDGMGYADAGEEDEWGTADPDGSATPADAGKAEQIANSRKRKEAAPAPSGLPCSLEGQITSPLAIMLSTLLCTGVRSNESDNAILLAEALQKLVMSIWWDPMQACRSRHSAALQANAKPWEQTSCSTVSCTP